LNDGGTYKDDIFEWSKLSLLKGQDEGICVLVACLVKVSVVSAHAPFPIGQPGQVYDLSNKLSFE